MVRRQSPARLIVALSVAACLAIFLLYTSIAGGGTAAVQPGALEGRSDKVQLGGRVVGPVRGDAHGAGLRFRIRDVKGTATVPVLYQGSVPDQFKVDRDVYLKGRLVRGVFVGERNSLVTKCPSKYTPQKD